MSRRPARPLIHQHAQFIADPTTMDPYALALARAVRPGDVVLDVGAGTGILGCLACRAGASRVYAIEPTEILVLAREIAAANGLADRISYLRRLSFDVELPERADVAIVSMLARFGVEDGILPAVLDLRQRLLKPGAVFVPAGVELFTAPVDVPEWYEQHAEACDGRGDGTVVPEALLADPVAVAAVTFSALQSANLRCHARHEIRRAGCVHAVAGWSAWTFCEGVVSGNAPGGRNRWGQMLFPLDTPVAVAPGDVVEFDLVVDQQDDTTQRWAWTVRATTGASMKEWSSVDGGSGADERDRSVQVDILELFDGRHTIRAIADRARQAHPDRFRSADETLRAVAELSRRWSD